MCPRGRFRAWGVKFLSMSLIDAGGLRSRACVQQREIKPTDGHHAEQALVWMRGTYR